MKNLLLSTGYFIDNEYLDLYVDLINSNMDTKSSDATQVHHILPRCYYSIVNEVVDNSKNNLVTLLYKNHLLAHYYLSLCSKSNLRYKLEIAFIMLCNFNKSESFNHKDLDKYQDIYESVVKNRRGVSPPNKGKPMSESQRKKISESLKGHKVSDETRKKMREAQLNMSPEKRAHINDATKNRNYKATKETRKKQSESLKGHVVTTETRKKIGEGNKKQKGNRWYTNGDICILIRPGEEIPIGFYRGTLRKGKSWYNNGIVEIQSWTQPDGFIRGRLLTKLRNKLDEVSNEQE